MSEREAPMLVDVWPELLQELGHHLRAQGDDYLAEQLAELRIGGWCGCRQKDCCTVYSTARLQGEIWHTMVDEAPGLVVLSVGENREIGEVEILDWDEIRPSYERARRRMNPNWKG
jgi:hypothetical protein